MKTRNIVILVVGIFAAWLASVWLSWSLTGDWVKSGQIGDTLGAVNALYSGLALCFVAVAIVLQKEELWLQREELASTRRELERTASAQERTSRIAERTSHIYALSGLLSSKNQAIDVARLQQEHGRVMRLSKERDTTEKKLERILLEIELMEQFIDITDGVEAAASSDGTGADS